MVTRASLSFALIALSAVACVAQPLPEIAYDGGGRSHPFDVHHIALDVGFDFERSLVFGRVTHRIRSLNPGLNEIRLDAAPEIKVATVRVDGTDAAFTRTENDLIVSFPRRLRYDDSVSIEISYDVSPKKGLYFIKRNPEHVGSRDQIWTQGEGEDHHYWIPMYDYPNDLATTEVRATLRSDWKLLANGRLVSRTDHRDGTATWHYSMEKPHAGYLMMLAAGDYLVTRDTALGVPLEYWSYPEHPERVEVTFGRTPDMLRYFDSLIGVPYPWNKYAQVSISRFMYSGMENTTATTLNDFSLVDAHGFLDYNPDGLIAHELAHQWFGDLVTNRSWDHLWIHESFATYLAARYMGYRYGDEEFSREMFSNAEGARWTDSDQGRSPIAGGKGYTANIYGRGAFVLHMLNRLVGEELFWRSVRHFLERNAHRVVETNDLQVAFEDVTGYDLDWFFDQWIYGAGMPELNVTSEYDGDSLRLIVAQIQPRDSLTPTFRFPLEIELLDAASGLQENPVPARRIEQVWISDSINTVVFAVRPEPAAVIVDAGQHTLKRIEFAESASALLHRFRFAGSTVDRIVALNRLATMGTENLEKDEKLEPDPYETIGRQLREVLEAEPSPWIREEIMEAAASLRLSNARDIIAAGLLDTVRSVRAAAVENAWAIEDKAERARLIRPMLNDSSNDVIVETLRMLAVTDPQGIEESLERLQFVEGPRQRTARAWMDAVAAGKFNAFADRVAWYALNSSREQTRRTAYETLGALTSTTAAVREAILAGLRDQSDETFKAALDAVKTHGDDVMKALLDEARGELSDDRWEQIEETM